MESELKAHIKVSLRYQCSPSSSREHQAQVILRTYVRNVTPSPGDSWRQFVDDEYRLEEYVDFGEEELVNELLESHNKDDYSYLQGLTWKLPPKRTPTGSTSVPSEIQECVREAFKGQFIGDLSFLKQHIGLLLKTKDCCSASFAIIQSSGTGKSRLIQELAAQYPTIPLCLRSPDDRTTFSWPPYDKPIYDYFNNPKSGEPDVITRRITALSFLKGLFDNAVEHLGKTPADWSKKFAPDNRPLAFYKMVLRTARMTQKTAEGDPDMVISSTKESLKKLRSSIEPCVSDADVPVVVSFDEAEGLHGYLGSFASAFSKLREDGVVGIYLSTNSSMPQLESSTSLIASKEAAYLWRPRRTFTELPLDIFAHTKFNGSGYKFSLDKIRSVETTASLGRPMWTAYLKAGYPISDLLRIASNKLAGTRDITNTGKLAVLASRLFIQCRPTSQAPVRDLVAFHLATAYFVTNDGSELVIGYPPEPFVSVAAFKLMLQQEYFRRSQPRLLVYSPPATNRDSNVEMSGVSMKVDVKLPATTRADTDYAWVGWLIDLMWLDWISRDDRGELVSRVILTLARDQAYVEDHGPAISWDPEIGEDKVLPGHSSIRLTTYIKTLVGQAAWSDLRQMGPVNLPGGKSLEDFFEKSVIDFTCFTATDDRSIFTFDGMVSALLQGAGVVCEPKQPVYVYDHVIPFLIDKDKGLVEGNIGIIGERAQDWKAVSSPIIDPCQEGVLGKDHRVPVITIVFRHGRPVMAASKFSREPEQGSTYNDPPPPPHYQLLVGMTPVITTNAQLDLLGTDTTLGRYRHFVGKTFGNASAFGNATRKDFATKGIEATREKRIYGVSANGESNHFKRKLTFPP